MSATPIRDQREQTIQFMADLFSKMLEVTLGEPFMVEITPGTDLISPDKIYDGFEAAKAGIQDMQSKTLKKRQLLKTNPEKTQAQLTFVFIETARFFGFHDTFLMTATRGNGANEASFEAKRMAILFIVRKMSLITMKEIADFLGYKDHSNVLSYKKKALTFYEIEPKWKEAYLRLEVHLYRLMRQNLEKGRKNSL
jgi:hypothetical protein